MNKLINLTLKKYVKEHVFHFSVILFFHSDDTK